jgi:4-aminobutyrate aminotransferase-like enzyme
MKQLYRSIREREREREREKKKKRSRNQRHSQRHSTHSQSTQGRCSLSSTRAKNEETYDATGNGCI